MICAEMQSGPPSTPAHLLLRGFLGFALVGAVGTAAHYAVLAALVEIWHVPVLVAVTAGFTVGAVVNYALSRHLVFDSGVAHVVALPRFLAIAAVGAFANFFVVGWLMERGVYYLLAQLFATCGVLFWNFAANHFWTFRR